jgi:hypothetical protein
LMTADQKSRRSGLGPPAGLRSFFIWGVLSTFSATDPGRPIEPKLFDRAWTEDSAPKHLPRRRHNATRAQNQRQN